MLSKRSQTYILINVNISAPCADVVCTGDSNVCIYGRCVCGKNGSPCSRTNPTCDYETGICQCGPKKNQWGGPYNICFLGQVCTVTGNIGRCKDADIPKWHLPYRIYNNASISDIR